MVDRNNLLDGEGRQDSEGEGSEPNYDNDGPGSVAEHNERQLTEEIEEGRIEEDLALALPGNKGQGGAGNARRDSTNDSSTTDYDANDDGDSSGLDVPETLSFRSKPA